MDERMITQAAFVFSCSVDAMIECEGMKAANAECESQGIALVHNQTAFDMLRDRMQNNIANQYH